ncbi:MAG: archaellin/type IV pilin N-terminal domain-containing protein [Candidatus Nanoarchaeia archaeon]
MNRKNKRGVSEIIGYILLIAITISISIFVYVWLKSYVPQNSISCPDGVSISIINYTYSCTKNNLGLTLQNTGTFNISGYYIHASNSQSQQIATIDLTSYYSGTYHVANNAVYYFSNPVGGNLNPFGPGAISGNAQNYFDLTKSPSVSGIVSLEITPVRFVELNGKNVISGCTDAKIVVPIKCS